MMRSLISHSHTISMNGDSKLKKEIFREPRERERERDRKTEREKEARQRKR